MMDMTLPLDKSTCGHHVFTKEMIYPTCEMSPFEMVQAKISQGFKHSSLGVAALLELECLNKNNIHASTSMHVQLFEAQILHKNY